MDKHNRIVSLDLVRVFSCICVTMVHFNAQISGWNGTFVYPNSIVPNFYVGGRVYLGGIGVSLFFMLSGVTLMMTYKKGKLLTYYKKRFLNIFPMFWLAYIIATVVDFFLYKGLPSDNLKLLLFSFIGMDGHLNALGILSSGFYKVGEWFLGCLLLLYAIFPILHFGLEKRPSLTLFSALTVYIGCMYGARVYGWYFTGQEFYLRIPELLLGMLFVKYNLREKPKKLLLIGGIGFLVAYLLRNYIDNSSFTTAFCVLLFAVLVCVGERITSEQMKCKLVKIANLTYPIFLVHHWLILKLLRGFSLSTIQRRSIYFMFLIYVSLTTFLAYMLNHYTNRITNKLFGTR